MLSVLDTSILIAERLDPMIEAAAHAHGARLVTADVDDVRHLEDLVDIVRA